MELQLPRGHASGQEGHWRGGQGGAGGKQEGWGVSEFVSGKEEDRCLCKNIPSV